jgi:NTP pyrophosphatase (non-canonical NTP hydrolase)
MNKKNWQKLNPYNIDLYQKCDDEEGGDILELSHPAYSGGALNVCIRHCKSKDTETTDWHQLVFELMTGSKLSDDSETKDIYKDLYHHAALHAIQHEESNPSLDDYQLSAMSTAKPNIADSPIYMGLALAGEAGEVANILKKWIRDGTSMTDDAQMKDEYRERALDELGDVLWYVAGLAGALGYDLSEVAKFNLDKLAGRYSQ